MIYCIKRDTSFLTAKLCIKQVMKLAHQDEVFFKIETKHGRNNCLLEIKPDKPRWNTVAAFHLFNLIALPPIYIDLEFSPRLPDPCVIIKTNQRTNTACLPASSSY